MDQPAPTLDTVFADADFSVRGLYEHLIAAMRPFGTVGEVAEGDGVVLTNGTPCFAWTQPLPEGLLVSIRSNIAIPSGRLRKIEQVEGELFDNELLLSVPNEIDAELLGWLRQAYDLAAARTTA